MIPIKTAATTYISVLQTGTPYAKSPFATRPSNSDGPMKIEKRNSYERNDKSYHDYTSYSLHLLRCAGQTGDCYPAAPTAATATNDHRFARRAQTGKEGLPETLVIQSAKNYSSESSLALCASNKAQRQVLPLSFGAYVL